MRVLRIRKEEVPVSRDKRKAKSIKASEYLDSVSRDTNPTLSQSFYQRQGVRL